MRRRLGRDHAGRAPFDARRLAAALADAQPLTSSFDVTTPRGAARVALHTARSPRGLVVLSHGAGGDMSSPVLGAVRAALVDVRVAVALFDQPYRVAGRRAPDPASHLDSAATAVVTALRRRSALRHLPVVVGGKSSGARVACRIASEVGAVGVVALGFPLHPPGRPERSRIDELVAAGRPALVTQGERDAFGGPADVCRALGRDGTDVHVHAVDGADHSFGARRREGRTTAECLAEVAAVVAGWVDGLLGQPAAT